MPNSEPQNDENPSMSDIESLRNSSELPHHWQLRRSFLLAHKEKFSHDRLICLSHVFVNVECMGAKYPEEVMKTVKELGSNINKSILDTPVQQEQLDDEQQHQEQQFYNQRNSHPRHRAPHQDRHSSPSWHGNYGPPQQRYSAQRQYPTSQSRYSGPSQPRHFGPPQNRYNNSGSYQPRSRYGRPFQQQEHRYRRDY